VPDAAWSAEKAGVRCDPGDSGGLWRSTDRGATWKRVPIKGDKGAVVDLFADAKRAGHLVVRTANHTAVAEGVRGSAFGGPVWRTRDGVWYIEGGQIRYPVKNFRFNQSIIGMLAPGNVELIGASERVGDSDSASLLPALKLKTFNFTSQSEAV
jgi:hypothetical protein